jgi:hypothetical protein
MQWYNVPVHYSLFHRSQIKGLLSPLATIWMLIIILFIFFPIYFIGLYLLIPPIILSISITIIGTNFKKFRVLFLSKKMQWPLQIIADIGIAMFLGGCVYFIVLGYIQGNITNQETDNFGRLIYWAIFAGSYLFNLNYLQFAFLEKNRRYGLRGLLFGSIIIIYTALAFFGWPNLPLVYLGGLFQIPFIVFNSISLYYIYYSMVKISNEEYNKMLEKHKKYGSNKFYWY